MFEIVVDVEGMACSMCEAHINDEVRKEFNVKKVASSHGKGRTVIITEEDIDENRLKDVINKTGYKAGSVVKKPYEKKGFLLAFKKQR